MNPVYSPASSGVPYANPKGIGYPGNQRWALTHLHAIDRCLQFLHHKQLSSSTMSLLLLLIAVIIFSSCAAGFPVGYAAAAPAYSPGMYPGANPAFPTGKGSPNSLFFLCFSTSQNRDFCYMDLLHSAKKYILRLFIFNMF